MIAAALVLFAAAGYSVWSWLRSRAQLLTRLRDEWGAPRYRSRNMDAISDLFRARGSNDASLDDRSWSDLLMDDVFAHVDRTESRIGQQRLYCRLRGSPERSLDAFEALIARAGHPEHRERAQAALVARALAQAALLDRKRQAEASTAT